MRNLVALFCLVGMISAIGCNSGVVTEADMKKVNEESNRENYEKAMKAAGREKELEAEKARDAAHRASSGGEADQDAGQH